MQCYAPTNDHEDLDKDAIYQQLQDVVNKIPCYDIVIFMGDLNAQVGGNRSGFEHVLGPDAQGKHSDNGDCLIQFCSMNNMKIGSSHPFLNIKIATRLHGHPMTTRPKHKSTT